MLSQVIVRNSNEVGRMGNINQAIRATREIAMINPHVGRRENANGVPITPEPEAQMIRCAPDQARLPWLAIMNADPVDDDVAHTLYSNAWPIGYLNPSTSTVNSLVTIHNELILESYGHVLLENDP